jgi:hypothetical protein
VGLLGAIHRCRWTAAHRGLHRQRRRQSEQDSFRRAARRSGPLGGDNRPAACLGASRRQAGQPHRPVPNRHRPDRPRRAGAATDVGERRGSQHVRRDERPPPLEGSRSERCPQGAGRIGDPGLERRPIGGELRLAAPRSGTPGGRCVGPTGAPPWLLPSLGDHLTGSLQSLRMPTWRANGERLTQSGQGPPVRGPRKAHHRAVSAEQRDPFMTHAVENRGLQGRKRTVQTVLQ